MNEYINVIKSLSDETRLRIMNLLLKANMELCVCEIEEILSIPQYNISKHIKELKIALLIKERKEGRFVFYSLTKNNTDFYKNIENIILSIPVSYFEKDNNLLLQKLIEIKESGRCSKGK